MTKKQKNSNAGKKHTKNQQDMIYALYADENGEIFDAPGIGAVGRFGDEIRPLTPEDLIPLPDSADLMYLRSEERR